MSAPPFVDFARACGVALTPGQRVLVAVAFDGAEPGDFEGDDRERARHLFGGVGTIPPGARAVVGAICGARAGKSHVLGALRLLHLALTVPIKTLAPGELAYALVVAPDLRLARQTLRFSLGAAEGLRVGVESSTEDGFTVRGRADGRSVRLECLPATSGGRATRGRSLVGAVLDECSFFRDSNYTINDAEIFASIAPRVVAGGQVICVSTPWAEGIGLLAQSFERNYGHPVDALAIHAPTTLLRDDEATAAMVARERLRDPDNARREFDAEFLAAGSGLFFDGAAITNSILDPLPIPNRPEAHAAGADFGFESDSSALAVVGRGGDDVFTLRHLSERRPAKGCPLVPGEVVEAFAAELRGYRVTAIIADAHYRQSIWEHCRRFGLTLIDHPGGASGKQDVYLRARELLHTSRLRLPKHDRLISQLRSVVSQPLPGGGLKISIPRRGTGSGHGDLVSALVAALWQGKYATVARAAGVATSAPRWTRFGGGDVSATPTIATTFGVDPWGGGQSQQHVQPGPNGPIAPGPKFPAPNVFRSNGGNRNGFQF